MLSIVFKFPKRGEQNRRYSQSRQQYITQIWQGVLLQICTWVEPLHRNQHYSAFQGQGMHMYKSMQSLTEAQQESVISDVISNEV